MMLTFSVIPQTLLVTGFQSTVNPTEKPSSQTPKPINHPQLADSFTPSAVKSRVGSLEEIGSAFKAVKTVFAGLQITDTVLSELIEGKLKAIGLAIDTYEKANALKLIEEIKASAKDHQSLLKALETLETALNTNSRNRADMPVIEALGDITFGFGEDSLLDSLKNLKKEQRGYKKNRPNS